MLSPDATAAASTNAGAQGAAGEGGRNAPATGLFNGPPWARYDISLLSVFGIALAMAGVVLLLKA